MAIWTRSTREQDCWASGTAPGPPGLTSHTATASEECGNCSAARAMSSEHLEVPRSAQDCVEVRRGPRFELVKLARYPRELMSAFASAGANGREWATTAANLAPPSNELTQAEPVGLVVQPPKILDSPGSGAPGMATQYVVKLPACRHCYEQAISDPLGMRAEPADVDTRPSAGGSAPQKSPTASGLSQLLGKVFEQLNVSAWLPAAMLVGNIAVLLQLWSNGNLNIALAVKELAGKPLGTVIILIFSLVLATIITQAFEFETIRLLEGYLDSSHNFIQACIASRIRRHESKRRRLERKLQKKKEAAFMQARAVMLARPGAYDRAALDLLEDEVYQRPQQRVRDDAVVNAVVNMADEIDWKQHLSPETLYRMDCIEARLDSYPQSNRLLPTRLGNVLRAAEDKLTLEPDENLEGFVIRSYDRLPSTLQSEHKDYRTRLDMYCCLVLAFSALAAFSIAFLRNISPSWGVSVFAASYAVMAYVCYEAAIASARGYGGILQEIDQFLVGQDEPSEPEAVSALTRLRTLFHRDPM